MYFIKFRLLFAILLGYFITFAYAQHDLTPAITKPIPISELKDYHNYSLIVRKLILIALSLSQKNLTYLYGSSDPKNNGMDCSGTIYYILKSTGINDVPRDASEMYTWAENKGKLYQVSDQNFHSVEYSKLKPGDLLFWSGTYVTHRNTPITHVMIYIGININNEPLMFGASDGRTYQGKKMWGVSVFDFKPPNDKSHARFVGYSCIPNLTCDK